MTDEKGTWISLVQCWSFSSAPGLPYSKSSENLDWCQMGLEVLGWHQNACEQLWRRKWEVSLESNVLAPKTGSPLLWDNSVVLEWIMGLTSTPKPNPRSVYQVLLNRSPRKTHPSSLSTEGWASGDGSWKTLKPSTAKVHNNTLLIPITTHLSSKLL